MVKRLLLAALVMAALCAPAQVVVEEVGALQDACAKARADLQGYRFQQALQALDPVVTTLSAWEAAGRLQPGDEVLLQNALEMRAAAAYNLGKVDQARTDFEHLVRLRPEFVLTIAPSAKVQKLFEEVRGQLTGAVSLQVDPADAQVSVDGRPLQGALPPQLPLLKGLHLVRASRAGYDPVEQEVVVEAGAAKPLLLKLVPNARTIYFFVRPQGAALTMDGKVVGRAETRADSRPEWVGFLTENGYAPAEWWAIQALNLPPGDHRVELDSPCHARRRFLLPVVLDKESNLPGLIKPLGLERRTTTLAVTSRPSGAEVLLDGKPVGTAPLELPDVCIGEHDLLVRKEGVGEYRTRIAIPDEARYVAEANLRPTLVWAGLTRDQETTPPQRAAADASLAEALKAAATFNAVAPADPSPLLPDTFFAPGVPEEQVAGTVSDLCRAHGAQALLAARIEREGEGFRVVFRLLLPGVPGADAFAATAADAAAAGRTLAAVDAPLEVVPREFLLARDGGAGLLVVQAPAAPDAPKPGDRLLSVDNAPAGAPEEVARALQGRERVHLKFSRGGLEKYWLYAPQPLPPVVAYGGPAFGYRRQWLQCRQESLSGGESPRATAGRLGAAFAALNLGRPADALEVLAGVPAAPGPAFAGALAPASADYARALALLRLGRTEEARAALQRAAQDSAAALDPEGTCPVKPLATELLGQLPPPPPPPAPPRAG